AGRGPEEGPQSAEADAPLPRERSTERAAGEGDQRWPQDGGGRRASRARGVGEGRVGHLASARRARVASQARQAGVHSEGERKTTRTRDSCHRRQGAASPGGRCAGTRVGGPVRIQIVWIPAGPRLPGRDASDLRDRTRRVVSAPVGVGRGPGRRIGCFVTLLLSLIVMVRTVLAGWVGAGYAGLFGVRCGRGPF